MVEYLKVKDRVGVRKNVTDLLKHLGEGEVDAVAVLFHTKDGSNRTYWNGNDAQVVFMAQMLSNEVLHQQEVVNETPYDRLDGDKDGEEE